MPTAQPIALTLYSRAGCHLCEDAHEVVQSVRQELAGAIATTLQTVDITTDSELMARYKHDIPVLHVDGRHAFRHHVESSQLRAIIEAA